MLFGHRYLLYSEDAKGGTCVSGRLCKPQLRKVCVRYGTRGRMSIYLLATVSYKDTDRID